MIDLHIHTTASDGELSPEKIVNLALQNNLQAIAITDHDSIDGIQKAIIHAKNRNLEVVPGIEIRCDEPEYGLYEIDILGLFIDYKNEDLIKLTKKAKQERIIQKRKMIDKLRELGFDISFEEVFQEVKGSFGRPHIAKILVKKYPNKFSSIKDVFEQYLEINRPAYVPRLNQFTIKETINIVHQAGGISILAHPRVYSKDNLLKLIEMFKDAGGKGIETYYPYHVIHPKLKINEKENKKIIGFYQKLALSQKLVESGGSDFHRSDRDKLGYLDIPTNILKNIRNLTTFQ